MRRQLSRGVRVRKLALLTFVWLLFAAIVSPSAEGSLLTLSTHASDGTNPPTYDKLDATLDFFVDGTELTLTVFNMTPENTGDPELKINEIYFNVSDKVTGLTLSEVGGAPPVGWIGTFNENKIQVNNFGKFDVSIIDGVGGDPDVIDPLETLTFKFDITGTGPFSDADFIELSKFQGGHIISYAAAKFYNDIDPPGDVSAYGATNVPEPASILLLGLGAFALLRKRRA